MGHAGSARVAVTSSGVNALPRPLITSIASRIVSTGYTSTPRTMAASRAFSAGRMRPRFPCARAVSAIGSTPETGRTPPSRETSPVIRKSDSAVAGSCPLAPRMPRAMGRSKAGPSLRMSAGARFTSTRVPGILRPWLRSATATRSALSRTAASGSPTSTNLGMPPRATSTSTSTR